MVMKFQLNVIEGDYGLPSMDLACLEVILYAKLARKANITINTVRSIWGLSRHALPNLVNVNTERRYERVHDITGQLSKFIDNDSLSAKQSGESMALAALVRSTMAPLLQYMLWVEHKNCEQFVMFWFAKAMSFPCNIFYTNRMKKQAMELIKFKYPSIAENAEELQVELKNGALGCLQALSVRLGSGEFFHGSMPTTIDAIVYLYLAPLAKLPLPSCPELGRTLLDLWPNLGDFIKRMNSHFFPKLEHKPKYIKDAQSVPHKPGNTANESDTRYRDVFLFGLASVVLLAGYAVNKGLIAVVVK